MSFLYRIRWLLVMVLLALPAWPVFLWTVARVEVEPDTFLVVTNRWGKRLPDGELVAPDGSYQGIQRRVLPEGRHFLNPLFYTYEVHPVVKVPEKYCAVLIRRSGAEISAKRKAEGDFLAQGPIDLDAAEEPGERGIIEQVLGPGKYRLNPNVYDVEQVPAIEIESQQVGVKVLRKGIEPTKRDNDPYVVNPGERGVQRSFVPSGTHYINPYVEQIIPVDVRSHTVVFEDIEFPSKDGFTIQPRVQVRYKIVPEKAPEIFVLLSEGGVLYQLDDTFDDQMKNPILQKIILPLIRGYVRIEGSKHDAREYISKPKDENAKDGKPTNPRERLQEELMEKVRPECEKVGIIVDYIAVGQTQLNETLSELAEQIREREQARIARNTNQQKVAQLEQQKSLESTKELSQQEKLVIQSKTKLERAKIDAERRLTNEETKLKAELQSAKALLEGSQKGAEALITKGKADAAIANADNEASVAGIRTAIDGLGSPQVYANYQVLLKLSPVLSEIFASDSSEFGRLFSTLLAGPNGRTPTNELAPIPRATSTKLTLPE